VDLSEALAAKVQKDLVERLRVTSGDEWVRVVARLRPLDQPEEQSRQVTRRPSAGQTREDFRRQLIQEREANVRASGRSEMLERLRGQGLNVSHGSMTDSVVIEGPSRDVARALEMDEIRHAALDARVSIR
jgi:hypothetical protein